MTEAEAVVAGLSGVRAFAFKGDPQPSAFIWDGKQGWWSYGSGVVPSSLTLSGFLNSYTRNAEIDVPDWWWSSKYRYDKENWI